MSRQWSRVQSLQDDRIVRYVCACACVRAVEYWSICAVMKPSEIDMDGTKTSFREINTQLKIHTHTHTHTHTRVCVCAPHIGADVLCRETEVNVEEPNGTRNAI
jgi:hypothetical protein